MKFLGIGRIKKILFFVIFAKVSVGLFNYDWFVSGLQSTLE